MNTPIDTATNRKLAVELFNATWTLLDRRERTPEETDRMIHSAHASRLHWELAGGTPVNLAVGEWQIARVYSVLGRGEFALHHARRCLEIIERSGLDGFHLGSACEGMARALAVSGDPAQAAVFRQRARAIAARLTDADERKILDEDLSTAG